MEVHMSHSKFRRIVSMFIVLVVVAASSSFAFGLSPHNSIKKTYSGEFKKAWQKSATYKTGSLVYGYNTKLINEDYSWAYDSKLDHYATVKNGKGPYSSGYKKAGKVASIEITHKTISVYEYGAESVIE